MKITPELLRKYASGNCTEEERLLVEKWLSDEEDLSTTFSRQKLKEERAMVWQSISANIPAKIEVIPLYKIVARYAAVACFAIAFFSAGYFLASNNSQAEKTVASAETEGQLFIYHNQGKTTKIAGGRYDLRFKGSLQLYNGSADPMVVYCGTKTLVLEPRQSYYLKGSDENPSIFNERHPAVLERFVQNLRGDFSVSVIGASAI